MARKQQTTNLGNDSDNEHKVVTPKPGTHLKIRIDDLKTFDPLTENQKLFFDAYKRQDYFMMLSGSAGVGKSFIALYKALEEVLDKSNPFKKVIIVRSAVQGRDMGFTPGSVEDKMSLYEQPYHQICETLFGRKDAYQRLCEQDYIQFVSTSFLRGCTFDDAIVVVDECQSMTFHELSSIVTRVGYRSKIIFCGDTKQNDLIKNKHDISGLGDFLRVAETMPEFSRIHFTPEDICRSSLVKSWIIACEKMDI
jgi:predicted ribonuclease YlaK